MGRISRMAVTVRTLRVGFEISIPYLIRSFCFDFKTLAWIYRDAQISQYLTENGV